MAALREIITGSPSELALEFEAIQVDKGGVGIMSPKSFFHVLRLRQLKSPAANILKQEMLSAGGECATARTVIQGDPKPQDAIVMGTRRQLAVLAKKLKAQPFGLRKIALQLEMFLKQASRPNLQPEPISTALGTAHNGPPLIMGTVNATPDSFSEGGAHYEEPAAVAQGQKLIKDGADIIDVGGESTRPGSDPVPEEEELRRVLGVIAHLKANGLAPISIDTMKSGVAQSALEAGATVINDVSAGRHDPLMFEVAAEADCPIILMHMLGEPKTMQDDPHYDVLMDELHRFFDERLEAAVAIGIQEHQILLDPGIGFGKRREDNYLILRRLRELLVFGRPLVVGVSRKSLLASERGLRPQQRLEETITAGTAAMLNGAHVLRVHDVQAAVKSRIIGRRVLGLA